jgi:hypothetical protein
MNTDINIKLTWFGYWSENEQVMYFEYNSNKFRIIITMNDNDEPSFYPQYIDDKYGAIDFVDRYGYSYDECIKLIKNYELEQ